MILEPVLPASAELVHPPCYTQMALNYTLQLWRRSSKPLLCVHIQLLTHGPSINPLHYTTFTLYVFLPLKFRLSCLWIRTLIFRGRVSSCVGCFSCCSAWVVWASDDNLPDDPSAAGVGSGEAGLQALVEAGGRDDGMLDKLYWHFFQNKNFKKTLRV